MEDLNDHQSHRSGSTGVQKPSYLTLVWLPVFLRALGGDVKNKDYSKLSRGYVEPTRKDLQDLIASIPGAGEDNVENMLKVLDICHKGNHQDLHKWGLVKDAIVECTTLLKIAGVPDSQRQKFIDAHEARRPVIPKKPSSAQKLADQEKVITDIKEAMTDEIERARPTYSAERRVRKENPKTDFTTVNKPSLISEEFYKLYTHEWQFALDELTITKDEETSVGILRNVLKEAYKQCKEIAGKQLALLLRDMEESINDPLMINDSKQKSEKVPRYIKELGWRMAKQFQRESGPASIPVLQPDIGQKLMEVANVVSRPMAAYIYQCVALTWLMIIQDPSMVLYWPQSEYFEPEYFKEFTAKGKLIQFVVWPALLSNDRGRVMQKGYVQVTDRMSEVFKY